MASGGSVTILHLSDLRFGWRDQLAQEGLGALLSRWTNDFDEQIAHAGFRPDLVIASGDFVDQGRREQFDRALAFLRGLRAHVGLPARRFVLVPGDHDINWNKSRAYFEDREGDGLPPEEPYFPKLAHYKRFFDAFYEGEGAMTFTAEEPWTLFEYPDLGVVVAGLNSVIAESHRDEDHHAFLGERQLRAFAAKLRPWKERGYLRLGVMHHDPAHGRGGAKCQQDRADLDSLLLPELNLLLHGETREEAPLQPSGVPILGVGRRRSSADQGSVDPANEYQLLAVGPDGVKRHVREWAPSATSRQESEQAGVPGESTVSFIHANFDSAQELGRSNGAPPSDDLPFIVERYRAAMVRHHGAPTVFDLLGVGDGAPAGGLDFLRLFVPQTAVRVAPSRERPARDGRMPFPDERDQEAPEEAAGEQGVEPKWWPERKRSVEELGEHRRLLVIGAPGAGKSALTRWLLLKLCVPGERLEGLSDEVVPVRLELRHFDDARRRAGDGWSMLDHVAREQCDAGAPLDVERLRLLAEQGRLLWLFDGLDEVVDPDRRRETAELIVGMLDEYRACRGVVTSRTAGVDVARPALEGAAFQTYALLPFTVEQRDRFLDAWHDLVFRRDVATGAHRRAHLGSAIEGAPSLQELCKSPLLCSMIAYLYREETLPHRRHLLYQKLIERMAEHWDANKGLPPRPATERFELEDKLVFLRALAWRMQVEPRTAGNTIRRVELEDFTAEFCTRRWGQSAEVARRRAEMLLGQLYERGAVLTYRGADTFSFAHRAFLEYLAAAEASVRFHGRTWEMEDLARVFVEHWRDASWEETLLLLCGLLQESGEEGCARVVWVLQSIGEGHLPEIVANSEAAAFGPWSPEEIASLLDAGRHRSEEDRIDICQALTGTLGMEWSRADPPIAALLDLAQHAGRGVDRVRAAWLLCCTSHAPDLEEIEGYLVREAQSDDPDAAREAVLRLVDLGYGEVEELLDELGRHARTSSVAFLKLADLAVRDEHGRAVLEETIAFLRGMSAPEVLLKIAAAAMRRGLRLFDEREVLGVWRTETDVEKKTRWISLFRGTPSAEALRIRASMELLEQAPNMGSKIWGLCRERTHSNLGSPVLDLWSRLMTLEPALLRLSVAQRVLALAPGGEVQARAEAIREEALTPTAPEDTRFQAALLFFRAHPGAEQAVRSLARDASSEKVRAVSAMIVGDLASLNDLGRRTADAELRDSIGQGLDLYGELRSLVQVGKLRRARVRFEGRDVGVLEELNRVGNGTAFQYLPEYDGPPVAPNMPVGRAYQSEDGLVPFFANLLPEGSLYEQTARRLGVKRNDRFGVLLRVGADTMGAVEVLPMEPA